MPNGNGKTFFCHWSRPDSERNKKPIKIKEALVLTFRSNLGLCHPTTELACVEGKVEHQILPDMATQFNCNFAVYR